MTDRAHGRRDAGRFPLVLGLRHQGPQRSAHDGLQVLIDESWRGRRWVVETDIANCFEAIPVGRTVSAQHPLRNDVTWWCEVMGGPTDYKDRLGGYITEQRPRFVTLTSCAAGLRLPARRSGVPRRRHGIYGCGPRAFGVHNSSKADDVVEQCACRRMGLGAWLRRGHLPSAKACEDPFFDADL
jgi:hypothetical protein